MWGIRGAVLLLDVHSWSFDGVSLTLCLLLDDASLVAVDLDLYERMAEAYPLEGASEESSTDD
jgi:hypothetical protein